MRNIYKLTAVSILFAITFTGCSEGGGSNASFESNTATSIAMCPSWTPLDSGDVVSSAENTQLVFDHDINGKKQVCVVSGSATVIKG
jgi:hypothetical protein